MSVFKSFMILMVLGLELQAQITEPQAIEGSRTKNLSATIDSLSMAEKNQDTLGVIRFSSSLTTAFQLVGMRERAGDYLKIAMEYANSYSDQRWYPDVCNRVGMYMQSLHFGMEDMFNPTYDIQKLDSAEFWFLEARKRAIRKDNINTAGWACRGLLDVNKKKLILTGEVSDSVDFYFSEGIQIAQNTHSIYLKTSLMTQYTQILIHQNRAVDARAVFDSLMTYEESLLPQQLMSLNQIIHHMIAMERGLDTLIQLSEKLQEQYKIRMLEQHGEVLLDKDQQYEVSKTKTILNQTSDALEKSYMALLWLVLGIGMALLVSMYLFRLYRKNKLLSVRNETLLKEQNHRVKNNLQMISSLLSLQSQKLHSMDAKDALSESQTRINSVALLHRMLYEGETIGQIDIKEYLKSLLEEIQYAVPRSVKIDLKVSEKLFFPIEKATSIGLIVNELVTNSIKHVPSDLELLLVLKLQDEARQIVLTYSDNGPGINPQVWETSQSFGNQLIRIQSEQLNGKYQISSDRGFQYLLKLLA